jgi:ribonuclease PH
VPDERHYEQVLGKIVSSVLLGTFYPRTGLLISIQVLSDASNRIKGNELVVLGCAINALLLALLHACLPIISLFSAVTLSDIDNVNHVVC